MRRYKTLIFMLALIAVLNLTAAVGSYLISQNIIKNNAWLVGTEKVKLAVETIKDNVIEIASLAEQLGWEENNTTELLEKSEEYRKEINNNINNIIKRIQAARERQIYFSNTENAKAANNVFDELTHLWLPLQSELDKLQEQAQYEDPNLMINIFNLSNSIKDKTENLMEGLDNLADIHRREANNFSNYLLFVNLLGFFCTFLIFIYLFTVLIKQSKLSASKLLAAEKESAKIRNTISEGICLINKNLEIGSQYSVKLEELLNKKKIAGQKLDNLLSDMISKQDLQMSRDFITQIFNEEVYEDLIQELNPLDKVEVKNKETGERKYLSFKFSRVYDDKENITNSLIILTDITKQVVLENKLEKQRQEHDEEIEMLSTVLNVSNEVLEGFLRNLEKATKDINEILKNQDISLLTKANKIFVSVHKMKGEASSLSLTHFITIFEDMEENITVLKQKSDLEGIDFLNLTIRLNRLLDLSQKIKKIRQKIIQGRSIHSQESSKLQKSQLYKFVNEIAERQNKKVEFSLTNYNLLSNLPENLKDNLHSAVIQLLRNAIVHGIENEELRIARQKTPAGKVFCTVKLENKNLTIQVGDDGGGINFEALREKAKEAGFLDFDNFANYDEPETREKLIRLMFVSGISTAKMQSEDAGRGVGMEVIKQNLDEIDASIDLKTEEGLSTIFTINLTLNTEDKG